MPPLPFVWPYWPVFWTAFVWAFAPEYPLARRARKAAAQPDSADAGSVRVITLGVGVATLVAFALAWATPLRMPAGLRAPAFVLGLATLITGSLLRRHCFRLLGSSFTGDVRVRPDQPIVTTGAYALVRHPSYTGGILMNAGVGLSLGHWGSLALLLLATCGVYRYRIAVEERALLAVLGEPYRDYMRTRRRLIPFLY